MIVMVPVVMVMMMMMMMMMVMMMTFSSFRQSFHQLHLGGRGLHHRRFQGCRGSTRCRPPQTRTKMIESLMMPQRLMS